MERKKIKKIEEDNRQQIKAMKKSRKGDEENEKRRAR